MLTPAISAKSSEVFINHLTDMIWKDCQGKDIHINQPIINYTTKNQTSDLRLIEWPYDRSTVRRIIELFGESQPYFATFYGTCENKGVTITGIDGCGILTSGDNKLDINGYNYFWNGVTVDVPKEEFKMTSGNNSPIIETQGDKSPVTTGPNSPISQQEENIWVQLFWSKGTIGGLIIAFILNVLYYLIKRRLK